MKYGSNGRGGRLDSTSVRPESCKPPGLDPERGRVEVPANYPKPSSGGRRRRSPPESVTVRAGCPMVKGGRRRAKERFDEAGMATSRESERKMLRPLDEGASASRCRKKAD
jgi:hypothetical protein